MVSTTHLSLVVLIVFFSRIQARNTTSIPALKRMSSAKDIFNFLSDTSLVTRQINCVLGKVKCDRLGVHMKKAIPEVVNNNCARCTSTQAANAKKLMHFVQHNYPVAYADVIAKYRTNKTANTTTQNRRTRLPARVTVSASVQNKSNSTTKGATLRGRLKSAKNSTVPVMKD